MTLIYRGPVQHFTARVAGRARSVACHPGKPLELPEDHPIAKGMVARGLAVREEPAAPAKTTKRRAEAPAAE